MKRGRPTSTAIKKNRTHCIVLTEKAEIVKRKADKIRNPGWFSRYVSERIIDDFGTLETEEQQILSRLLQLQETRDGIDDDIARQAKKLRNLRRSQAEKEIDKVLTQ